MIAINLNTGDELSWVKCSNGKNQIIMVTKNGLSIKFSEKDVRSMGRPTAGVLGIRLKGTDAVVTMDKVIDKGELIVITEKGFGKRSKLTDWPLQGRAGYGVKAADIVSRNGKLVSSQVIGKEDKNIIITSKLGQVIKLPIKDVPVLTRQTQGVILIRFSDKKDVVAAASSVKRSKSN
jgi:DNA gyrase subunit A